MAKKIGHERGYAVEVQKGPIQHGRAIFAQLSS